MVSMMDLPREGHLKAVLQMLSFLKSKHIGVTVFNPTNSNVDLTPFPTEDWSTTPCGLCKECMSSDSPAQKGMVFIMRTFVDSGHSRDSITCRSRTDFILFLNNDPIFVCSKKQWISETSSFGSEFIAMKSCCEHLRGLLCEL